MGLSAARKSSFYTPRNRKSMFRSSKYREFDVLSA
jgi:hypothetical protein